MKGFKRAAGYLLAGYIGLTVGTSLTAKKPLFPWSELFSSQKVNKPQHALRAHVAAELLPLLGEMQADPDLNFDYKILLNPTLRDGSGADGKGGEGTYMQIVTNIPGNSLLDPEETVVIAATMNEKGKLYLVGFDDITAVRGGAEEVGAFVRKCAERRATRQPLPAQPAAYAPALPQARP